MGGGPREIGEIALQVELLVNPKQDHDGAGCDPKCPFTAKGRACGSKREKRARQIAGDDEPGERALVVDELVHLYSWLASRCLRIRHQRITSSTKPQASGS